LKIKKKKKSILGKKRGKKHLKKKKKKQKRKKKTATVKNLRVLEYLLILYFSFNFIKKYLLFLLF
jgi:hypothetical protein